MTMGAWTAYSPSRGSIHISPQPSPSIIKPLTPIHPKIEEEISPSQDYIFNTGFLSHPADIKTHLWIYKTQREIARRLPYYRGEVAFGHPKFSIDSDAALNCVGDDGKVLPVMKETPNIKYTPEDDEIIEQHIRDTVSTTYHSLGTCAMKKKEERGVVDELLNIYGVRGLKVLDLSIAPENVGANTYHTALTVGEKGAMILAEELGLEL